MPLSRQEQEDPGSGGGHGDGERSDHALDALPFPGDGGEEWEDHRRMGQRKGNCAQV